VSDNDTSHFTGTTESGERNVQGRCRRDVTWYE